jgi:hypothetical protein
MVLSDIAGQTIDLDNPGKYLELDALLTQAPVYLYPRTAQPQIIFPFFSRKKS